MQQFFAHHLKGEPAPEWMKAGVPYLQKGRDQLSAAATVAGGAAGQAPNGAPPVGGAPAGASPTGASTPGGAPAAPPLP
jgi:hypothetical protein